MIVQTYRALQFSFILRIKDFFECNKISLKSRIFLPLSNYLLCNIRFMKKRIAILFYFLCLLTSAFSSDLNSLLHLLRISKEDTNKVKLLLEIEDAIVGTNPDSAMYYTKMCKSLINKLNDTVHIYSCNIAIMEIYGVKGRYDSAIIFGKENLLIANKNKKTSQIIRAYVNLSFAYTELGKYKEAVENGLMALKLSEEYGDTLRIALRYANISRLYMDIKQFDKAIYYGEKGIASGEKYNDIKGLIMSLNNTGVAYAELGNKIKPLECYKKQYKIAIQSKKADFVIQSLINILHENFKYGYYDEYDKYFLLLKENFNKNNQLLSKAAIANFYVCEANYYLVGNNPTKALVSLNTGMVVAEQDSNIDGKVLMYQTYAKCFYSLKNVREAEYYSNMADSIQHAIFSEELTQYSLNLETKYETQKKENEILKQEHQIKKRNTWLTILAIILTASLLLFYFFSKYQKNKNLLLENEKKNQQQKIIALEKEKQLQATESILKGQEDERSRIAKDLHDGLGGLLSGVKYSLNNMKENVILSSENATSFERTVDMLDSGIQELRRVAHNMMPENLIKFGLDTALKDYCTSISNTGKLNINYSSFGMNNFNTETNVSITVYRVIQELINNTMKHAEATQSIVQIANENNVLHITVEDNGKGFDVQNINNFKGAGWTNIQNRITYLKGKINVDSNEKNGTSIIIEIPLV